MGARRLRRIRINIDPQNSEHKGLLGIYEVGFRRFKTIMTMLTLMPMYGIGIVSFGLALTPGIWFFKMCSGLWENQPIWLQSLGVGCSIAAAYVIFGFSMIVIAPTINFLMRAYPKPWRGTYYSLSTIRWAIHNALTYFLRYTFLEFMTPTPFNLLFYRLMGMKIGRGSQINTTNISDPSLIEIGNKVTVGGSATLVAHYGQGGYLVIAPVKIRDGVTVGLRAIIMGDVEIGKGAKILPNSVVMPKTRIPEGETWGGVPAKKIA